MGVRELLDGQIFTIVYSGLLDEASLQTANCLMNAQLNKGSVYLIADYTNAIYTEQTNERITHYNQRQSVLGRGDALGVVIVFPGYETHERTPVIRAHFVSKGYEHRSAICETIDEARTIVRYWQGICHKQKQEDVNSIA